MKRVRKILIKEDKAIIFYIYDRPLHTTSGPSRRIQIMTKMISLGKLAQDGILNLYKLEEIL